MSLLVGKIETLYFLQLIEIDLRLEKGFKQHLSKEKDEFLDKLFQEGIDNGHIGVA